METFFFDQTIRRRRQYFRKTVDDLKASRRDRPPSAAATRFKFDGNPATRERSDRDASGQVHDKTTRGDGVRFPGLVKLPEVFEELRSNPSAIPALPNLSPRAKSVPRLPSQQTGQEHLDEEDDTYDQRADFEHLQFGAPNILSQLARLLYSEDLLAITLPLELKVALSRSFSELASGAKTGRREWQTEAYRDMAAIRLQQQQEEEERLALVSLTDDARSTVAGDNASVFDEPSKGLKRQKSHRRSTLDDAASVVSSVPSTYSDRKRSTESIKSTTDFSEADTASVQIPRDEDDPGPVVLRYRRESRTPKYEIPPPAPRTRLEKFTRARGRGARQLAERLGLRMDSTIPRAPLTINFSLASSQANDKGWLVKPSSKDPEHDTIVAWLREHRKLTQDRMSVDAITAKATGNDKPLVNRYYGDSSRQEKARLAALRRSQRRQKKTTSHEEDEDMRFLTQLPDGSRVSYYPSGQVAVCSCHFGKKNEYAYSYVYADDNCSSMLAVFTPSGHGCCYDKNGMIRVLTNELGGHVANENGAIIREWHWPLDRGRLQPAVLFQLNELISFRCLSRYNQTVHFLCQHESVKFSVGAALSIKSPDLDTLGTLQTDHHFASQAASLAYPETSKSLESIPSSARRRRRSNSRMRRRNRALSVQEEKHVTEILTQPGDVCEEKDTTEEDLTNLQAKIRGLVDMWMDTFREATGIKARPSSSSSLRRSFASLLSSRSGTLSRASLVGSATHSSRQPTAVGVSELATSSVMSSTLPTPPTSRADHTASSAHVRHRSFPGANFGVDVRRVYKHWREEDDEDERKFGQTSSAHQANIARAVGRASFRNGCPVSMRTQIVNRLDHYPPCRCDKRRMPQLTDVEFALFLNEHMPKSQLVIIFVRAVSGMRPSPLEKVLDDLYWKQAQGRATPCQQAYTEPYRLLCYTMESAADSTGQSLCLLQRRHNASAEMVFMFFGGKLVFAGDTFNGYSNSKTDFLKQIPLSLADAQHGRFLASDYRLPMRNSLPRRVPLQLSKGQLLSKPQIPSNDSVTLLQRRHSLDSAKSGVGSEFDTSVCRISSTATSLIPIVLANNFIEPAAAT